MKWLSDDAVVRLRAAGELPDLSGTKYRLLEGVARGGMGAVFLAEDVTLGRRVALKTLHLSDPTGELAARMLREAQIVARLEHPGIVPVHDVGRMGDGCVFYTMKYVQGARLDQHLGKVHSLADRLRIFLKICDAVAFAHTHGVLHRDLKPQNIMVGPFGEVLVMDWGLAKILAGTAAEPAAAAGSGERLKPAPPKTTPIEQQPSGDSSTQWGAAPVDTAHGAVIGTPGYIAPEQALGETRKLDQRTDVFSLGAVLAFLATEPGTRVPRPLAAICAKAMAHAPAERYDSALDLAADVARFLDGQPVTAYPESVFAKAGRLISRHRVAVLLALAYLIMRVLLLVLFGR